MIHFFNLCTWFYFVWLWVGLDSYLSLRDIRHQGYFHVTLHDLYYMTYIYGIYCFTCYCTLYTCFRFGKKN
jgi:hypothetical protein